MYKRVLFVVLILALLAGGVGLGVHLLHRDALAPSNTPFFMMIDWGALENIADDQIDMVVVRTRTIGGELLDEEFMHWSQSRGTISDWKASFSPNTQSVIWEVEIFSDFEWNEDPPLIVDGDDVVFYEENLLQWAFHLIF